MTILWIYRHMNFTALWMLFARDLETQVGGNFEIHFCKEKPFSLLFTFLTYFISKLLLVQQIIINCLVFPSAEHCTLPDPIRISPGKYKSSFVDMKVRQIVNLCMGRIRLPGKPIGCTYHDINQACPYIIAKSFGTVELRRQQLA